MRIPGVPYVQGKNTYKDADGMHYGIAIHNTSNDASDVDEAQNATHRSDGVSSHFYVDADSIRQSLDTNARAGHAGSANGNNNSIAFEFTGTNSKTRTWWLANIDWDETGRVIAYILDNDPDYKGFQVRRASIAEMKANPKVKAFYGHDDMRRAWGGTTHTDPGPNFPWDKLFSVVNAHRSGGSGGGGPQEEEDMPLTFGDINAIGNYNYGGKGGFYDSVIWAMRNSGDAVNKAAEASTKCDVILEAVKAIPGVDTSVLEARIAEMRAQLAQTQVELAGAIDHVDENVMDQIGREDTPPADTAAILKALLGDRAAAVAAELAKL